jgi:hypothetical protein
VPECDVISPPYTDDAFHGGGTMLDNQWHKMAAYLNRSEGIYRLWWDDNLMVDETVDGACATFEAPDTITMGSIDAEEETNVLREYDDFKIYNGMPPDPTVIGVSIQ